MLVDVRELFRTGVRLDREEVRATKPVRAKLDIDRMWTHRQMDRAPVHAQLIPPKLEPLFQCQLLYWRGRNIVLKGQQRAPVPKKRNAEAAYDQMWWCQLVIAAEGSEP